MRHPLSLLPVLLAAVLLALPAQARWGETYTKCVERYGLAKKETKDEAGAVKLAVFEVDDIVLTIGFVAGKANSLVYQQADRRPLKAETIVTVLANHEAVNARFQPIPFDLKEDEAAGPEKHQKNLEQSVKYLSWVRSDGAILATWIRDSNSLRLDPVPDLGEAAKPPPKAAGKPRL